MEREGERNVLPKKTQCISTKISIKTKLTLSIPVEYSA